jgi:hypothetical protein
MNEHQSPEIAQQTSGSGIVEQAARGCQGLTAPSPHQATVQYGFNSNICCPPDLCAPPQLAVVHIAFDLLLSYGNSLL